MKSKKVINREMAKKKKDDDLENGSQPNYMERNLEDDKKSKINILAS